jgi:hypothetical protein
MYRYYKTLPKLEPINYSLSAYRLAVFNRSTEHTTQKGLPCDGQ